MKKAFTMAEILLSLTIIGVVAAITLPSLTGNINERLWNTQRKALYARFSQALALMPALNGYGTLAEESSSGANDGVDTAAETFVTNGLSKVLKINNICDNEHLADCGITTSFTNMAGSKKDMPKTLYELNPGFSYAAFSGESYSAIDTRAAAFETANGENIVAYYNPSCSTEYLSMITFSPYSDIVDFPHKNMCVNFIYDLNGTKGPNTVGKDIGILTVFNATDASVVAPIPSPVGKVGTATWKDASKMCTNADVETRLPNIDELSALVINYDIVGIAKYSAFWPSNAAGNANKAWTVSAAFGGTRLSTNKTGSNAVLCIRR